MELIAMWPKERRQLLFEATADTRRQDAVLMEKDFWVCWTLARLFSLDGHTTLVFKGGTALSKVYGAIGRFSEDIDLTFDRSVFGLDEAVDRAPTVTQREKILKEIDRQAKQYVAGALLPALQRAMQETLPGNGWELTLEKGRSRHFDELFFRYPLSLDPHLYGASDYNRPVVRIEVVARAECSPNNYGTLTSYAAESFPEAFTTRSVVVRALAIEYAFCEKLALLHREHHIADVKPAKPRLSRHYADVAAMAKTLHADAALRDPHVLRNVVEHTDKYFRDPRAQMDSARIGTLRLAPAISRLDHLRADYRLMEPMFVEPPPPFDAVMDTVKWLEDRINAMAERAGQKRRVARG